VAASDGLSSSCSQIAMLTHGTHSVPDIPSPGILTQASKNLSTPEGCKELEVVRISVVALEALNYHS
jgi:hypothetical protein